MRVLILPTTVTQVAGLSSPAIQWATVVGNAKAFRKTTPGKVQRWASAFVGSLTLFTMVQIILFAFVFPRLAVVLGLLILTVMVIAATYFVAASRLLGYHGQPPHFF